MAYWTNAAGSHASLARCEGVRGGNASTMALGVRLVPVQASSLVLPLGTWPGLHFCSVKSEQALQIVRLALQKIVSESDTFQL